MIDNGSTASFDAAPRRLRGTPLGMLALLTLLALAVRLGSIEVQSLWRDEVDAVRFGRDLANEIGAALAGQGPGGLIDQLRQTLTRPGFNGPAYFLALDAWARLAGTGEFAVRFFSAFFGALAIPLTYALARRLFMFMRTPRIAPLAAWLTAISPYFAWYSQETKMYTEITALAIAAIYGLRRAVDADSARRAGPWWALVVAATTLALYSHILAALLIGVEVVLFLSWWPEARRHLLGGAISLALLSLPYLPLGLWQVPLVFTPAVTGFRFYRFDEIVHVMLGGFANGILPLDYALGTIGIQWNPELFRPETSPANWGTWLLSLLSLLGALMWKDARDRGPRLGLLAWAVLPTAVVALVSLNRPIFVDRYLIWIGPAVYVLAALGIDQAWQFRKPIGIAALVGVTLVSIASLRAQAVTPVKSDFRSAARYVQEHYQGEAMLFQIPYGQFTFDYYFEPAFRVVEGPFTNYPDRAPESFEAEIANALRGQRSVWLVATEVEMWDSRRLLEDWLDRHGRVTDRAAFTRVSLARYEFDE